MVDTWLKDRAGAGCPVGGGALQRAMEGEAPAAKRPRLDGAAESSSHFTEHFNNPEIDNLRVAEIKALAHPQLVMEEYPSTSQCVETVRTMRKAAQDIISGKSDRVLVIVGPCSIHDPKSALEYAKRLQCEAQRLKEDLVIMMRVYFEKPRTTIGWKVYIYIYTQTNITIAIITIYIYMCVCMYVYIYIYVSVSLYIYMYIYIYMCIYIYIYIYILRLEGPPERPLPRRVLPRERRHPHGAHNSY